MKEVFLLKEGEIALKGLNRHVFEETFTRNLRRRLSPLGKFKIHCAQSTVYIEPMSEDIDMNEAFSRVTKVFGANAACRALVTEKDFFNPLIDELCDDDVAEIQDNQIRIRYFN